MQEILRESAVRTAFEENSRFRNVSVLLAIILVGLHCFNAYVAYYAAREYHAPSPLTTDAFALHASLSRNQLVAQLLAAQDFVETESGVVRRTLVLGATVWPGGKNVTLHLIDGRIVNLF